MATSDSPKLRRVPIFRSGASGYGDSRHFAGGREHSYNRSGGTPVDMRWDGEIREGVLLAIFIAGNYDNAPIFATEWENTSSQPLTMYVVDNLVVKISASAASTFVTLNAVATCAVKHDNGSGVPYLFTGYGGTSALGKIQSVNRAGTQATSTNIYADKMLSLAGDLYISVTPASGTANCSIGKIAAGSDPASVAFPSLTRVGDASRGINNIVRVRYAPICLKPEGIFSYDRDSDTWINHAPWMEYMPHPDNGKRFSYEDTDLIVCMGTGGAVKFDGYTVTPYDFLPAGETLPDLDTTTQLIAAAGSLRHWSVAATQVGAKRQRRGGGTSAINGATTTSPLSMFKTVDDGANYTNYTTQISDGDASTVATLDALDTVANGDWLVVGHQQPFNGIYFDVSTANANVSTMTVSVWNDLTQAWVACPATVDLTSITTGSKSLGRSGWVVMGATESGVQAGDLVLDPTYGWAPSTINGTVRYWARISFSAALSATVRVRAVELQPYRPSIDYVNFAAEGLDRSGGLPHILMSRMQNGQHVVHDMGRLSIADEIGAVLHGPMGGINGQLNDDRLLMLFGKRNVYGLSLSVDDRPQQYQWPNGNTSFTSIVAELAAVDMGNDVKTRRFLVDGKDFQRTGYLYYRWDDGLPWRLGGTFTSLPTVIEIDNEDTGRYLHVCPAWTSTTAQGRLPIAPRITSIDADVEDVAEPRRGHLPQITAYPVV